MPWTIEFDARAKKELARLDRPVQTRILTYLRERIATNHNPKRFGKVLRGGLSGLWRYRVDDYRILCRIERDRSVVLIIAVGHRRRVY